jgi:hypothetical protein
MVDKKDGRSKNGAPKKGDKKKVAITIYKQKEQIDKLGGIALTRAFLSHSFDIKFATETTVLPAVFPNGRAM